MGLSPPAAQAGGRQAGFTLVELLIALVIGMVLLAGLYSNFILQSRVQNAQAERVTSSEDLQIAAQLMQKELRLASSIAWDGTNKVITYTTVDSATGYFKFKHLGTDTLDWKRPGTATYQELVRGLDATSGLSVVQGGSVWTITLTGKYEDHNRNDQTWQIAFKVWPRNL